MEEIGATNAVVSKRGRPPKKGKPKLMNSIVSTGKGRGRPKKLQRSDAQSRRDKENGANRSMQRQRNSIKGAKGRGGRPRKVVLDSDEDMHCDDEERRPVGRPNTGGVSLNIATTGLGQGRPKGQDNEGVVPRKRGRPKGINSHPYVPTGRKKGRPKMAEEDRTVPVPYVPTGKPRGRPKKKQGRVGVRPTKNGNESINMDNSRKARDDESGGES